MFLAAAFVATASSAARAESHAWSAAKKALPANLTMVGGISFDAIRSSQLFQTMWPMLLAQSGGDAQAKLDAFKSTCGFDPLTAFDSAALGMDDSQQGAIVVSLKGTDQKGIEACLTKVAKADGKTASISKAGALTKYSGLGDKDVYLKWLSSDTFAIATAPDDKALLTKYTAGGIDKDKSLKGALASVKTDAALWGIGNKQQDLSDIGAKMLMGYGSADLKSGTIGAEIHIVVDSAKAATTAAAKANAQLAEAKKSGGIPPALSGLVNSVQVKASGSEIVMSASMAEKDLLGLIQMMGLGAGGGAPPSASPVPPPRSSGAGIKPH